MSGQGARWAAVLAGALRVEPGTAVRLPGDFDPGDRMGLRKGKDGARLLARGRGLLAEYQRRLAAQDTYGVLVVLQAIDAGGKDGTIRHVMSGVDPQGVTVSSFKAPSAEELGHDYLWRHARRLPARGQIGIFNRSHYEEVLVARVRPGDLGRERLPAKARGADARERRHWADYQRAYSEMLSCPSTDWAPWHVLPADRKWLTRACAAAVIAAALIEIDPHYPVMGKAARAELAKAKAALEAEAPPAPPPTPPRRGPAPPKRRADA